MTAMPFDGSFVDRRPATSPGWRARLAAWREARAARRHLRIHLALDPRFARDVGLTPDDLAREIGRPFWHPIERRSR